MERGTRQVLFIRTSERTKANPFWFARSHSSRSTPCSRSTAIRSSSAAAKATRFRSATPTSITATLSYRSCSRWIEQLCRPRSSWSSQSCRSDFFGRCYSSSRWIRSSRSTTYPATSASTSSDDFATRLSRLSYCYFACSQRSRSPQTVEISPS